MRAKSGKSAFKPVFVGWQEIALYTLPLDADFDFDKCDDYEKALYIHDYIVNKCRYLEESDNTEYESTAYGCLVEGVANCEGYAKAFNIMHNVWNSQGASEKLETEIWDMPHACPIKAQQRVLQFFKKNL